MFPAFRILPVVVLSLLVMFALRAVELWTGFSAIQVAHASDAKSAGNPAGVSGAIDPAATDQTAAQPAPTASSPPSPTPDAAPADSSPANAPASGSAIADASATAPLPAAASDEPKDTNIPGLAQAQPAAQPAAAPAAAAPAGTPTAADAPPKIPGQEDFMTASEIEVLESLTKRREELDERSAQLDMREKLLQATEQRLDQKLAEIKEVETQVQSVVHTLDDNQEKQIASLVKVYETMKPADAAKIMQDLDRNILIEVAARMKEAKMAPILAAMDPAKAREVTVLLAKRNEVPGRNG